MYRAISESFMSKTGKAFKILIVDDDKAFLRVVTELLSSLHHHIIIETARSGKECLREVKSFSPNLVFLDIGMDGMNGLVTLRFIKSIDACALVYLLSGRSEEYLKEAVKMVPADGYYTKPQFIELLSSTHTLPMIHNSEDAAT